MADLSNVLSLLAAKASAVVYPNGTGQASICSASVRVYPGWPVPNRLESDLKVGNAHISIYPLQTERRKGVALGRPYRISDHGDPTITVGVTGKTVTFAGTVSVPQNIYLLVNGTGYMHAVQTTDTLTSIATAFTSLIAGATSSGAVLSIPSAHAITARVGGVGSAVQELKRQEKDFQLTVWAHSPSLRDQLGSAIDSAFAENSDLTFPDGSHGVLLYARTIQSDQLEKAGAYRRDLIYSVEYATTKVIDAPQVIAPILNIQSMSGKSIQKIQE